MRPVRLDNCSVLPITQKATSPTEVAFSVDFAGLRRYIFVRGDECMNILVTGGTRFFGIPMVNALLDAGHEITIASRGRAADPFGSRVRRIICDRNDAGSLLSALGGCHYDVVIDKIAYCSNDIRRLLDVVRCERYILMSTTAVYRPKVIDTTEDAYCGATQPLVWCERPDFPYDEVKRQAENALCQCYGDRNWTAVRYPVVLGADDYTNRLRFYVENTISGTPMHIDNLNCQMSYIRSLEAGRFLAFLAESTCSGPVNGASSGTISPSRIVRYVEEKTGRKAVLSTNGSPAPYNGEPEFSINTDRASALGFEFSRLHDWIYELLDFYIDQTRAK